MRPFERLAVDIFLEQALLHHQAEIVPRTAPWRIGALVDDVAKIVQSARILRLVGFHPFFAGLPALPGASGEAENLHLHVAALQGACQHIRADRGDGDRATAHRAGIIDQKGYDRVAELGLLLDLERERRGRVGNDASEAARIQQPFIEIEFPTAVLPGQQPALQFVGEPSDCAFQRFQLLVEKSSQAFEFGSLG